MLYLKNLSSEVTNRDVFPWDFKPQPPIPEEVRRDKNKRDAWINAPATRHHVYTFCEGVNPNLRISKPRNDGSGNPVRLMHALVADYDSAQPEEKALQYARELPYPPNWIERTLSGNWRFVWLFEEPLIFPSDGFARHFLKTFKDFAFDPSAGCPGFDRKAWEAPERLWTNGCDWRELTKTRILADVSRGWLVKASATYRFTEREFGTAIPLEIIKPEMEKLYPRIVEWPGEFALNEQGPTFWVDGSTSPKSAIIRETGIQTFSAHATKGFYTWADLLGIAFVRQFEAEAAGRAVEGIYYNNRHYWKKVLNGSWQPCDKDNMKLHLRTSRGVSPKPDKTGISPLDRALEHIHNAQIVHEATPYIYQPSGILIRNGRRILNISDTRVLSPADGVAVWGHAGQFPWLSKFFDIFPDQHTRDIVRAWIAWAYKNAFNLEPAGGQVLFVAGPAGVGKTLFNRAILGKLFGGFAEAGPYLTGEDSFNSELFRVGLWCQDDGSVSSDPRKFRYYSEMLKRIAANPSFRNNGKYLSATMSEWLGRLVISCNDDEQSMVQLPDTAISNLEKLILVRTAKTAPHVFPSKAEINRILDLELPWFARWLLDWEIPEKLRADSRFGVKHYADPSLLETSRQSSPTAGFAEILDDWKHIHFTHREPDAECWEGTAFRLFSEIMLDQTSGAAMRFLTPQAVGRHLASLKQKDSTLECCSEGGLRKWRIHRPKSKSVEVQTSNEGQK